MAFLWFTELNSANQSSPYDLVTRDQLVTPGHTFILILIAQGIFLQSFVKIGQRLGPFSKLLDIWSPKEEQEEEEQEEEEQEEDAEVVWSVYSWQISRAKMRKISKKTAKMAKICQKRHRSSIVSGGRRFTLPWWWRSYVRLDSFNIQWYYVYTPLWTCIIDS